MAGADHAHCSRAAILLVIGVEDEQDIHRPLEPRIDVVFADLPHHVQEVGGEAQIVVRVDERQPDREPITHRSERWHLGNEAQDLLVAARRVLDFLGVVVERSERRDSTDEHAHRMGVVVEPVDETLAHVLVDEGVAGDLGLPDRELIRRGELAVEEEVGHFEIRTLGSELFDRITAVAQDARFAIEIGDRALARCRLHECRVVHVQRRIELAHRSRGEDPVGDRDRDLLSSAIVGDGDGVGHVAPSGDTDTGAGLSPRGRD